MHLHLTFPLSEREVSIPDAFSSEQPLLQADIVDSVKSAIALHADCLESDIRCMKLDENDELTTTTLHLAVLVRISGGIGGFARQLQRMGKEFRLQRQMQRRAHRTQGPGEGIYRDLQGRRVVVVSDDKKKQQQNEDGAAPAQQQQQQQKSTEARSGKQEQQEVAAAMAVAQAAREAKADERRNLVSKIVAAVREGTTKVNASAKRV